ncbi:hypothetical protein TRFO_39698 [Tritrichomonas foetus]|uniref:Uncharacterized protein n=1 Tax=Tritrichomonas foetus TaxID=1144522 RepID=A0A1J4J7E7_9EUKA|nr:hypothetical protein TRFO_39698 [Tritrichomonas foetus]|eukprot:OHS94127.1 hypothetical protein TRFO_39698 [Tritrichomonas foetus]
MKKRLSLGTIATHREELELVKKSMELDDEIEYLNAFIDAMEENFKTMFGEVTAKRLISEFEEKNGRKPKTFNYYDVIDNIDLHVYPYVEWANKIEQAIAEKLE